MAIEYQSIVVLTGAGVSAESGVPTFRGPDGLWEGHRVEDVATPEAFARDPVMVQRFYNMRRRDLLSEHIRPNPGHLALAELEQACTGSFLLITQNVDNLHERGGSQNLLHMHGELLVCICQVCGHHFRVVDDIAVDDACGRCGHTGGLRPDIVWFGEMPKYMDMIHHALAECDLLLSAGTSGNVYPAAGFAQIARQAGASLVEVNLQDTGISGQFHRHYQGPSGDVLPELVSCLKAGELIV
jgi:NAD-dependent deacetylase